MKTIPRIICAVVMLTGFFRLFAQSNAALDLSTRCVGVPPTHASVDSVAKWLENPLDFKLTIAVTNLYADADDYMEINIAGQHFIFNGAGTDGLGNYIPTNFPPIIVDAMLRREYPMSIMCPNSGPNGSPLFKLTDFAAPEAFIAGFTNGVYPSALSAFIWSNFSSSAQILFTNGDPGLDPALEAVRQTNLVVEMNRIVTTLSIYDSTRFSGITLSDQTASLLGQSPTGQKLWHLNRLLLQDGISLAANNLFDSSGTAEISFGVNVPIELKIKKNQPAPSYTILLNRDSSGGGVLDLINLGVDYVSTNYSTIEVRKDKFAHYSVGDGCDDASKAPGQGTWLSLGPGCTQDTNRIALDWRVSLGRSFDGLAAGQLVFREPALSRSSYTPFAIYYNGSMANLCTNEVLLDTNLPYLSTNVSGIITTNQFIPVASHNIWYLTNVYTNEFSVVVTDVSSFTNCLFPVVLLLKNFPYLMTNSAGVLYTNYDNLIRQVKSYQTFVDILSPDTNQTILNFYLAGQVGTSRDLTGLYTNFNGSPFVTWTIKNPSPSSVNSLLITENRTGGGSTNTLTKANITGGLNWTLTQGAGSETRVETRTVTLMGSPPTNRVEENAVYYSGSATPAFNCRETYHFFPWGSELVETKVLDTPNLTTSYEYYDALDSFDDPDGYGYGRLARITYPDGFWEKRRYWDYKVDGLIDRAQLKVYHPYIDATDGGALTARGADDENSTVTEYYGDSMSTYNHSKLVNAIGMPVSDGWSGDGPTKIYGYNVSGLNDNTPDTWNDKYTDGARLGLAGHMYKMNYNAVVIGCLYDHGVYNSTAAEFSADPENHIYSADRLDTYPDHRESTLYLDQLSSGEGKDQASEPEYTGSFDTGDDWFFDINGHWMVCYLKRGVTKRTDKIYHCGNLVQVEEYVYSGFTNGPALPSSEDHYPVWLQVSKMRYFVDSLGRATNVVRIDTGNGEQRVMYSADYRTPGGGDGPLLNSETRELGQKTVYAYDSLQRVGTNTVKGFGAQPDRVTSIVYDANGRITRQTTTAGTLSSGEAFEYDLAGRMTRRINSNGFDVRTKCSDDGLAITNIYPGNVQVIQKQYISRRPQSMEGNGCVSEYYAYTTEPRTGGINGWWFGGVDIDKTIIRIGSAESPRWNAEAADLWGHRRAFTQSPTGGGTTNTIWHTDNYFFDYLISDSASAGFPTNVYGGDYYGTATFRELEAPGEYGRTAWSKQRTVGIDGTLYKVATNFVYLEDGNANATIASVRLEQLNNFAGGVLSRTFDYDGDTNESVTTTLVDRANNKLTTITSQPNRSSLAATNVSQNGLPIVRTTLSVAEPMLYFYDALGRTNRIQSPLGYNAYINYDPATGWITSMTDFTGQGTSYQYYATNEANAGKIKCQINAAGKTTYFAYTSRGELSRTWGDVPFPAEYRYSEYGDLTNLVTFRGGGSWTSSSWPGSTGTGDNTYWSYDAISGALLRKTDALGNSIGYTYSTNTGRLFTRSLARLNGTNAITVTNNYNGFGDLVSREYNDGTPGSYFNSHSRAGSPREIVDGTGTQECKYDHANRLITSSYSGGIMNGITVSNHFDSFHGRDSVAVLGLDSSVQSNFGYDGYGRLATVSCGAYSATYAYMPGSDLLQTTTSKNGADTVLTTTRAWDYGTRLRSIRNVVDSSPIASHDYQFDALSRRTRSTLEDDSWWLYGYDDRDQLTSASRHWSPSQGNTPVAGQQFSYTYDNIGNRQSAGYGGDTNGANLRTIGYTNNNLNQCSYVVAPAYLHIIGVAFVASNVTVNGGTVDRKGEYYHSELTVANGSRPIWQNVTNASGTYTNRGGLVFPANSQDLSYDADGNITFDGVWSYCWDAENQLISMAMTNVTGIADANRVKLDFVYDFMGRRVQKMVSVWNTATNGYVPLSTNRFIYDGGNLLAIIDPQSVILQSFVWGQDVSGTMFGSGGVSGLLVADISGTNCFVAYDGNGNITALVNSADKSLAARYEYGPYGELLRETGMMTRDNPFRFSTKYRDTESGLIYYGFRYYNPVLGKWISRDPVEEKDQLGLYAFVKNNGISNWDSDGREASVPLYPVIVTADTIRSIYDVTVALQKLYKFEPPTPGNIIGRVAAGPANAIFYALLAVQEACEGLSSPGENGLINITAAQRDASDFVRHLANQDLAYADLDAVTLACDVAGPNTSSVRLGLILAGATGGLGHDDALAAWYVLQQIEDAVIAPVQPSGGSGSGGGEGGGAGAGGGF